FLLLACALAASADTIEAFGHKWSVPIAADWKLENGVLHLQVARPQTAPRRPSQFALAETTDWQKVTVEAEVKRVEGSLIIVYAYRDAAHFNYVHLSHDTGMKQPVHNGIFHVYGGDRVRISSERGPAALPSADEWYQVKVDYDGVTGTVTAKINGADLPALKAVDMSLGSGKVGIGSFFQTAFFRNVKISETPAQP
ncbi:MAG: hypothetical protein WKF37_03335, partial [Bryobacteraceae bacterium]